MITSAKLRFGCEYDANGRLRSDAEQIRSASIAKSAWSDVRYVEFTSDPSDSDIDSLLQCEELVTLTFSGTAIRDSQLCRLCGGLKKLQRLFLSETSITDDGLQDIAQLKELRRLNLSRTGITDKGARGLGDLSQLVSLLLDDTQITDEATQVVRRLSRLAVLWLDGTRVTDAGLKWLAETTSLTRLHLDRTCVTDEGLKSLGSLSRLEKLHLSSTDVTDDGRDWIRTQLPGLTLVTD